MQSDNFYYSEAIKLYFKHKKWQFIKAPTPAGEFVTSGIQTSKILNETSTTARTAAPDIPWAATLTQLVIWQESEHIPPFSSTEEK